MNFYNVAAIQMNSQPDLDANLKRAEDLLDRAAHRGALLACLPENFAFLGDMDLRLEKASEIADGAEQMLREKAADLQMFILGGSFPYPAGDDRVFNRSLLIDPAGEVVARFDKIHLFDVDIPDGFTYRESDIVKAGEPSPVTYSSEELGTLGLSICYDLRFPELYRRLVEEGALVLFVPSAFTRTTGQAHWHALLRARAIENTSYVVAPAQTGKHGEKRFTYGHSLIIDPWGEILVEKEKEKGIIMTELSPERLDEVRGQIPALQHRVL